MTADLVHRWEIIHTTDSLSTYKRWSPWVAGLFLGSFLPPYNYRRNAICKNHGRKPITVFVALRFCDTETFGILFESTLWLPGLIL